MINQRTSDPEIVVGTDGSAAAATAVEYALRLAELEDAPVRIVHVVASHRQIPPHLDDKLMDAGRLLLDDVVRRAQLSAPDLDIRSSLLVGPRRAEFVGAARGARLVVLGRSARLGLLATGSTATALVEQTDCPVRVVPPGWRTRTNRSEVVVALKDIATAHPLVARGFAIAAELDESLVLLHTWGLPSGYEDVVSDEMSQAWNKQLAKRIEYEAARIRKDFPDVAFQVRIEHARTATALEVASQRASFLLLGRSIHHGPVGRRTGLAHVLMNVSECPVEVGPEPRAPVPLLQFDLEASGELVK
ncbi:MAG: universal stress protein [Marmoricola sp.]|nr:universal stress protein [Marmoricola sp.]